MRKIIEKINKKGILSAFIVILAYSLLSTIKHSPSLPSVDKIAKAGMAIVLSESFATNALYTIRIVITGILIALTGGFVIAVICSMFAVPRALIMPIINATKNIPSIALFPLFIVLMGIGDEPRIFVIIWNSTYPIIASIMAGLNSVDKDIVDAALNCGAGKKDLYFRIKIPLSFINLLEGLKISAGNGFVAIVVAEMLGATKGLGYMILWSANAFKYPDMYFYILVVALIGLTINVAIEKLINFTERKMYHEEGNKYFSRSSTCINDADGVRSKG